MFNEFNIKMCYINSFGIINISDNKQKKCITKINVHLIVLIKQNLILDFFIKKKINKN